MTDHAAKDIAGMRKEYRRGELRRADLHEDPLEQFRAWLQEALDAALPEPYAVTVATVDAAGQPGARVVLLRGFDARGLTFYTNYESRKGHDIQAVSRAALLFYWPQLERQVRVEGRVERVSAEESDRYFHSRPRESQLAAHASTPQSGEIENREALDAKLQAVHERYPEGTEVPRPDFWGGYRVVPAAWEFWQGRESRTHDRFRYERAGEGWRAARLMP